MNLAAAVFDNAIVDAVTRLRLPVTPPARPDFNRCAEDYFETFVPIYDEHFSQQYGFRRPYVQQVINRYFDCGDLHKYYFTIGSKKVKKQYP